MAKREYEDIIFDYLYAHLNLISVILTNDLTASDDLPVSELYSDDEEEKKEEITMLYNIIYCEVYAFCICYLTFKLKIVNYNSFKKHTYKYIKLYDKLIHKFTMDTSSGIEKYFLNKFSELCYNRLDVYQDLEDGNLYEYLTQSFMNIINKDIQMLDFFQEKHGEKIFSQQINFKLIPEFKLMIERCFNSLNKLMLLFFNDGFEFYIKLIKEKNEKYVKKMIINNTAEYKGPYQFTDFKYLE